MGLRAIPAVWMRGGTSKGLFVREADLPAPGKQRDELILELFGSPDPMQIDGVGGGHSHTSKLMAVSPSSRPDADVDYLFAQVSVDKPVVDYGGTCGNLTSAVGAYAVEEGLVEATEPTTVVRLYNKNTEKNVVAHVPVKDGRPEVSGGYRIAGVPRGGARIINEFIDPSGAVFEQVLPTSNKVDRLKTPWGQIEASIVDVTNPLAFVRAADLGLAGVELPEDINNDHEMLGRIEDVRAAAAVLVGLVENPDDASTITPGIPKLTIVAPPRSYRSSTGETIAADRIDVCARIMSMQKLHHAYAVSGAMCTGAAVCIEGTIPAEMAAVRPGPETDVRIGHPKGIIDATVAVGDDGSISSVAVSRTARRIMAGEVYFRGE